MLNRSHRFHGHNSLRFVYRQGKTVHGSMFAIRSIINERRRHFRVAVVVSKKVSKSAVVRNRIRRRLYALVRQHTDNIVRPYDIVLTVYHASVADMPADELARYTSDALAQAGVLTNHTTTNTRGIIKAKERQ